ncbi:hypothetical protein BJX70DRAFT_292818 [Aspergillus crustosus]
MAPLVTYASSLSIEVVFAPINHYVFLRKRGLSTLVESICFRDLGSMRNPIPGPQNPGIHARVVDCMRSSPIQLGPDAATIARYSTRDEVFLDGRIGTLMYTRFVSVMRNTFMSRID